MSDSDGIDGDGGSEESGDEGSDDESYDYGFMGGADDDDDDDEEYEVSYADMNVSPEILRMLGASEEVIAAKKAEIAGIAWVPPTETGLEHSAAIAACDEVALGKGHNRRRSTVERVFKVVGSYEAPPTSKNPPPIDDDDTPARAEKEDSPGVLKLKIAHAPQPVPEKLQCRLPPPEDEEDGNSSGSDTSWDEESMIDGHAWWEAGSDEECDNDTISRTSPNLRALLGLRNPAEDEEKKESVWRPPVFAGLQNSNRLVTLSALAVGKEKGLEIRYNRTTSTPGDGDTGGEGDWDSDEEGWDIEDVPDEEYILDWSTNISPNLAGAMGKSSTKRKSQILTEEFSWKPPTFSGLGNSSPLIRADAI